MMVVVVVVVLWGGGLRVQHCQISTHDVMIVIKGHHCITVN